MVKSLISIQIGEMLVCVVMYFTLWVAVKKTNVYDM
jgi:hypothetical protein